MNHAATASIASSERPQTGGGKYLTFKLGPEEYGLPILKVLEIIGYVHMTPVPGAPGNVGGVINLRGQVIAVTDLRRAFGMSPAERSEKTCIIIVEIARGSGAVRAGLLVDSVCEVLNLRDEDVEQTPALGATAAPDYLLGIARSGQSVKILLDVDHLPGSENL